ncbi:hypothetical protein A1O1_04755 [Capronia coronata CBS 617.96]|uniref:ABM domain-containing protein n=1 Tax=Capronia coronata CBS 617.96 TaxID=1182541 RepID=W9Y5P3_9EURO|nr:uncharacterized protein A1O1_04755 [Capronia coronata CBS 617.96]EXJ87828.1 hypothetical protein A1O1_04755 [Capronia coronata CBS 617.96]
MAPVHLAAFLYPKADKFDEFEAAAAEVTKAVLATEPDVFRYYTFRTESEYVFVEGYKTEEAHAAHVETEHFKAFFAKVSPLFEKPPVIKSGSFVAGFENR